MKATKQQVSYIENHVNTVNVMRRGKSLTSFLFSLSRLEADALISRLDSGEEIQLGR